MKREWEMEEVYGWSHGPKTFAAVLLIIFLSVVDAYLTLDLVSRGAEELNPVMAYYLERGPLTFFVVKYLLTCVSIIMILSIKEASLFGFRIQRETLLWFFILTLAIVVEWELFMLDHAMD